MSQDKNILIRNVKRLFLKGMNSMIVNKKRYEGISNYMKNGQCAKIVKYRNSGDIDILFEDGTLVEHRTLNRFLKGQIENPNVITVAHNMSTPETITYIILKYFFPDLEKHYRPSEDWGNMNIDLYIPSLGIGIEVDEYSTHRHELARFSKKEDLVKKSNIKKLYTISERGCIPRNYSENQILSMKYDSHNFSGDKVSLRYREGYFRELEDNINTILKENGIKERGCITEDIIEDVTSKNAMLLDYEDYLILNKHIA